MKRYVVYIDEEFSGLGHDEFLFTATDADLEKKIRKWAEGRAKTICRQDNTEAFENAVNIFRSQLVIQGVVKASVATDWVELAKYTLPDSSLESLLKGIEYCKKQIANTDFADRKIRVEISEGPSEDLFGYLKYVSAAIRRTKFDDGSFEYDTTINLTIKGC